MFGGRGKPAFFGRVRRIFYPDAGWKRTAVYHFHRMRRIKDTPDSIARGVFVGTLVSFTPLFGLHFLVAPLGAWVLGGNILASILGIMVCNPLTFPLIAVGALSLGTWIIGAGAPKIGPATLAENIVDVGQSIWLNFTAIFTDRAANWMPLAEFMEIVFLPYFVGGSLLGIVAGAIAAVLAKRVVAAYQRHRRKSMKKKKTAHERPAAPADSRSRGASKQ